MTDRQVMYFQRLKCVYSAINGDYIGMPHIFVLSETGTHWTHLESVQSEIDALECLVMTWRVENV